MRTVIRKEVRWATLIGAAILACGALMTSARAAVFRIDLQGTFTNSSDPCYVRWPVDLATRRRA